MTPSRLAALALVLWPLSYLWVPFEDRGAVVIAVVVVSEIGALVAGTAAVVTGLRARCRWPVAVGAAVVTLVVGLNVVFAVPLS